ncbi:hypothetical protein ACTHT3_19355, partial [Neisseria sp. P0015.S004]
MKLVFSLCQGRFQDQPPSGGCVLKLLLVLLVQNHQFPAAFGRLCVETNSPIRSLKGQLSTPLRAAVCLNY